MYLFHVCFTGLHFVSWKPFWLQDLHLRFILDVYLKKTHPPTTSSCLFPLSGSSTGNTFHPTAASLETFQFPKLWRYHTFAAWPQQYRVFFPDHLFNRNGWQISSREIDPDNSLDLPVQHGSIIPAREKNNNIKERVSAILSFNYILL